MAKKNWFIEANKSQDPEVKALLGKYNELDANADDYESQKVELVLTIKEKLGLVEPAQETPEVKAEMDKVADEVVTAEFDTAAIDAELDETVTEEKSDTEPEVPENSESAENAHDDSEPAVDKAEPEKTFAYTESDAAKATTLEALSELKKACRAEIQRLEKTRLKHGTYKENRILDTKIWSVRRIVGIALKREIALKERARRIRNSGRVSSIALKRARFVKLMRQGISITNITKHPEGVKKEELKEVLDEATLAACKSNNSRFPEMWERWKAKFLDNKDEKKQ